MIKRPEVWFLIALALGSLVFALWPAAVEEEGRSKAVLIGITSAQAAQPAVLERCTLVRDHGNARLDLDVLVTNAEPGALLLAKPVVRLLAASDRELPAYILPTERPPQLPPQSQARATLRFWLEKADLAGVLTLEVQGAKLAVKSAPPFDLETLTNDVPQVMKADW